MKKVLATVLTVMVSQIAFAGDMFCGANVETTPGSQVYNKPVFWEKADITKHTVRYLLKDGTLIRAEDLTPATFDLIANGTKVLGYSFDQGRTQLFVGTVQRGMQGQIQYTDLSFGLGTQAGQTMLMAGGATLSCVQQ